MALNAWQLITRVLPGQPFGNGSDGPLTISSSATQSLVDETCTGTATSTALTAGGTSLTNGDLVLIHQTRGTGAGQWEINLVSSGGGSVNLVMAVALKYTYAAGAQVIKIPQYADVTVNSSQTWSAKAWDLSVGGILLFAANRTVTISGALSGNALGYYGGGGGLIQTNSNAHGIQGSSATGTGSRGTQTANGGGGGAGMCQTSDYGGGGGGGGGGNGSAGAAGGDVFGGASEAGAAGGTDGDSGLTDYVLGAGGAGGGADALADPDTAAGADGGKGGAGIMVFCRTFASPNSITTTGANGSSATAGSSYRHGGGGGGGAGGSILLCAETVNIGTDKLTTVGGTGGNGSRTPTEDNAGGAGGKGRVAVYYGSSLTGSLSSTYYGSYTNAQDTNLIPSGGWFMFF